MRTVPGSLFEGAVERSETEGVYFDERKRSKISEPIKTLQVNHWHKATIERHSLSHALAGVPAPSEREPGGEWEEEILVYPPCHNHGGYRYPGESRVNDKEEIL